VKRKIENLFRKYNVQGISCDSRNLKPGDAFFAIKGEKIDGNRFINEALKTAKIVFTGDSSWKGEKIFYIQDIRLAVAIAAEIIYPHLSANLVAVTGTNGKTSVVSYIYQILKLLGQEAATIGTIGVNSTIKLEEKFLKELPQSLTTADPITFRKILNELAEKEVSNVIFEASSHGIAQRRLGEIKAKTAGFTSFSQDHLDYHKTMENYLEAKLQLFRENLEEGGEVVINSEILASSYGDGVKNFFAKHRIRYFGIGRNGNIKVKNINSSLTGSKVVFEYNKKEYTFTTNIIGSFQAVNLLIAAKMTANLGFDFDHIVEVLEKVTAVTGRLQRIGFVESEVQVFVDYAHTPDALEKSLWELRNIKAQQGEKLYVVFGCGGDRDPSKRELMGQVACKLADYVVVTDDNPRSENPQKIRLDVLKGAAGAEEIEGREFAIESTIAKLKKNDILLIAGKGHETYQIIGNRTVFFSDIEIAKQILLLKNK
jgi:UDP-N-acetylmuramoyl-L-alanyl-D-glutamate--2,6-diaminopimelate ligase